MAKSAGAICRVNTRLSGVLVLPMRLVSVVILILDMAFGIVLMVLVVLVFYKEMVRFPITRYPFAFPKLE